MHNNTTQLNDYIKLIIENPDTLDVGGQLPSVRELAHRFSVSRSVAARVLQSWVTRGLLESRDRIGYFVPSAQGRPQPPQGQCTDDARDNPKHLNRIGSRIINSRTLLTPTLRKFLSGEGSKRALFDSEMLVEFAPFQGIPELRTALVRSFSVWNEDPPANQIVVTAGLLNALAITLADLRLQGRPLRVVVAEPCQPFIREAVINAGFIPVPCIMEPANFNPTDLAKTIQDADPAALILQTDLHNPTGASWNINQRFVVASTCRELHIAIIECIPYPGLCATRTPSFWDLNSEQTYQLFSLNKTLWPGAQLGFAVFPLSRDPQTTTSRILSSGPSRLAQLVLSRFLAGGHWKQHSRELRDELARLHRIARKQANALAEIGSLEANQNEGFFTRFYFQPNAPDLEAAARLADEKGILIAWDRYFFSSEVVSPQHRWMRVNVSHIYDDALPQAVYTFCAT